MLAANDTQDCLMIAMTRATEISGSLFFRTKQNRMIFMKLEQMRVICSSFVCFISA